MSGSVFLTALGVDAELLHPAVREYVEDPGVGEGVFDIAGSRLQSWNLLARPLLGPDLLVTAYERNVPFRVENRVTEGGDALRTTRVFRFSSGEKRVVDALRHGPRAGTLRNVMGRSGRLAFVFRCEAVGGNLLLTSERMTLRIGRVRIRVPSWCAMRVTVLDGFNEATKRQTIDVEVRGPLMGTVMEYRGSFTRAVV